MASKEELIDIFGDLVEAAREVMESTSSIEEAFIEYERVMLVGATKEQRAAGRRAFFGGSIVMLRMFPAACAKSREVGPAIIGGWMREANQFAKEMLEQLDAPDRN